MDKSKIKDPGLAAGGKLRIEWAESRMPVLMALREKHGKSKSLKGMKVAGCLHVTKETAVLVKTIVAAGAEVSWSGCNPLSTQDDVAAALAADGHLDLRVARPDQGRVLLGHRQDPGVQARRSPWMTARISSSGCTARAPTSRRESSAAPRRPPRASIACGPWARRASSCTPSSR